MKNNDNYINCEDIYEEEFDINVKTAKRFREAWLKSSASWNSEFFQYGDDDFYFYKFAINALENNTVPMLKRIINRIMERYSYDFKIPDSKKNPFSFLVKMNKKVVGFRFTDLDTVDDINKKLYLYRVDVVYIIRTWKGEKSVKWIKKENEQNKQDGINLRVISLEDFFVNFFGEEQYKKFAARVNIFLKEVKDITGYSSIKILSYMNLASQKLFEEKTIKEWEYNSYKYQILDANNPKVADYMNSVNTVISNNVLKLIDESYINNGIYKTMLGRNEYAESFITSEWLYYSLKGKKNFDYTAVISGYLKSIEQLLSKIVLINTDNNCKIAISGANNILKNAYNNHVPTYFFEKKTWKVLNSKDEKDYKNSVKKQHGYIDLIESQLQYMDSSIGTFEFFIRYNSHIFVDPGLANVLADLVSCFRTECRNGYFHTHNLNNWEDVEKTRSSAIYLYYLLLGSCIITPDQKSQLGIVIEDKFDELCIRIREFSNYNCEFIFEYSDNSLHNMIYDFINNTIEYSEDGIEHYENLIFYEVEDFSLESYEKLSKVDREKYKILISRDNLPQKIIGLYRNRKEEIIL